MRKTPTQLFGTSAYYMICLILAVIFAGPFVWMLSSSLKPASEIFIRPPVLISPNASLLNYQEVFRQAPFDRYMFNSFFVATTVTVVALLLHSMAGYALARLDFPGKRIIFIGILATLMIPFYSILIPLALMMRDFGWFNTYLALIVPAIPHAFGIFCCDSSFSACRLNLRMPPASTARLASAFSFASRCRWRVRCSPRSPCSSFWQTGTHSYGR